MEEYPRQNRAGHFREPDHRVSLIMYGAYYNLFITAEQPAAKLTAARGEMRRRGWILPYLGGSLLGRLYVTGYVQM